MPNANGRAPTAPRADKTQPLRVLKLADLNPERVTVEAPGRTLYAWVCTNQRYPASVAAELEDARTEYLARRERVYDGPPPPAVVEAARALAEAIPEEDTPSGSAELKERAQALRAALKAHEEPVFRARATDWESYLTRCLMILIPGLESWEADLMPPDQRLGWLFDLGYFSREEQVPETPPEGEGQRPPDQATTSTGDVPAPDLAGSTT